MRTSVLLPPLAALLLLPGCIGGREEVVDTSFATAAGWRALAGEHDRERLRGWRGAWEDALSEAREAGHGGEIAAAGALLDPDAALAGPALPPGDYRCRTIKLGSQGNRTLAYVAYPFFRCQVRDEGGQPSFVKVTGSQRPIGLLYPENTRRMIFLGTLQLGDERLTLQYGRDRERDMIGIVERIGDARWRLVFPRPHFESTLDVLELVPAPPEG